MREINIIIAFSIKNTRKINESDRFRGSFD